MASAGKKITQADLANYFNVSQMAVSKWETGDTECSYYVLWELSKIFSCSIDDFFKEERSHTERRESIFEGRRTEVKMEIEEGEN